MSNQPPLPRKFHSPLARLEQDGHGLVWSAATPTTLEVQVHPTITSCLVTPSNQTALDVTIPESFTPPPQISSPSQSWGWENERRGGVCSKKKDLWESAWDIESAAPFSGTKRPSISATPPLQTSDFSLTPRSAADRHGVAI